MSMRIKVKEVAYHRNGVCGEGFHVVTFTWRDGRKHRNMVATIFSMPEDAAAEWLMQSFWQQPIRVAILDLDETMKGNIAFAMGNSWRGDDFAPELFGAIRNWEREREAAIAAQAPA